MSSQQYKLEKLIAKKAAGKPANVKIGDKVYTFGSVVWGGTSPRVYLTAPDGIGQWLTAKEWTLVGAKF